MKGILVYQPPGRASQVAAFIEDLEPRLREKIIRQLYRLTLPQKPEMKEPHFKRFSLECGEGDFGISASGQSLAGRCLYRGSGAAAERKDHSTAIPIDAAAEAGNEGTAFQAFFT